MPLTKLIHTYRGPLIGLVVSWGAPLADAIEIAQDSFAEAWLKRQACHGDWQDPDVFGRWLRGVALNRYRNWSRSRWRQRLRFVPLDDAPMHEIAAATDAEPAEHLVALRNAIDRLPTKQRQVVLMHYLEETSVKQVAVLLAVSEKTVEGRLYQARRALRRMLGKPTTDSAITKVLLCL